MAARTEVECRSSIGKNPTEWLKNYYLVKRYDACILYIIYQYYRPDSICSNCFNFYFNLKWNMIFEYDNKPV